MPEEYDKILKHNQGEKSIKSPHIIYADLRVYLKKHTLVIIILKNHQQPK